MNCRSLIWPLHRLPENELYFCHVEEQEEDGVVVQTLLCRIDIAPPYKLSLA